MHILSKKPNDLVCVCEEAKEWIAGDRLPMGRPERGLLTSVTLTRFFDLTSSSFSSLLNLVCLSKLQE